MKKQFFTLTIIISLLFSCTKPIEKPNIVILIADDVSWDDLGCYGNEFVKTPNIDNLADDGLVFKNTYLTTSSCSPSRNSVVTGRYPQHRRCRITHEPL